MSVGLIEVIVEAGQMVLDLLKGGNEREALVRIKDFRQQIQANRDAVDEALRKKHGRDD
jgi:hypothetical protein